MGLGLENKVALVAASSKGLGLGVARALALHGAKVSLCSRHAEEVEVAARKIRDETGAETLAAACDVTKPDEINRWIQRTVDQWGIVYALLVNAGGPPSGFFKDLTDDQWRGAFELTLLSAIRLIRTAIPHMKEGGSVLAITSYSINTPIEALALSTVMRSGVAALLKTLAEELAPDGIRVNNLVPGRILTDRTTHLDQNAAQRRGISFEEVRAETIQRIPLGRLGTTEEFGNAAAFLLSPAASYITGATLRADGGLVRSTYG
jgi:3-oxoacyl-[acyl-carrier protein] reductase